jgi:hypothetical protein
MFNPVLGLSVILCQGSAGSLLDEVRLLVKRATDIYGVVL